MEKAILENDGLLITILPRRGGKLASIIEKESGLELLAQPCHNEYPTLTPGMAFHLGDASGFDDVFPSMGDVAHEGAWPAVPDHGALWTAPMQSESMADGLSLHLSIDSWRYEKRVRLKGNGIWLDWHIRNTGACMRPFVWVCHCLWRLEEDMRFFLPMECNQAIDALDSDERPADVPLLPIAFGTMMKRYLSRPLSIGKCGFCWPSAGLRVTLGFNPNELPYLGFWMSNGGWHGARHFAFEPSTAYYDTLARADQSKTLTWLQPDEERRFSLRLHVEKEDKR